MKRFASGRSPGGSAGKKSASKPITSFFFKKPAEGAPDRVSGDDALRGGSGAGASASPPAPRSAAPDAATPPAPAAKRRKASDGASAPAPAPASPRGDARVAAPSPSPPDDDASDASGARARRLAIPPSSPARHDAFVAKLSTLAPSRRRDGTRAGDDAGGRGPSAAVRAGWEPSDPPAQKLTPLELQVVRFKAEHPGVVLLIEVGYKFHFYGEDAHVASKVLNVFAYQSRNFLTASVPVPRLHVYARRLVDAGLKVGVVRQTETAALKASGETEAGKSGLFERKLVGLYTKSTLEAGVAIGEDGATNDAGESKHRDDGRLSSYLLCVAERCASGPSPARESGASSASSDSAGTVIGVAAIDTSTGDVSYDEFADDASRAELEARLLRVAPEEVLLAEPLRQNTTRLVAAMYGDDGAGGGEGGDAEGGGNGGGVKKTARGVRVERVEAARSYADGGAKAAVAAAFAAATKAAADHRVEPSAAEAPSSTAALPVDLPGEACRALATAFEWLRQFGLGGSLALAKTFRRMSGAGEMSLSPNVLRQLEILRTLDGAHKGSLLWLVGANAATSAGGRLLRRWVAHPLADRAAIEARLDAVAELRDAEPDPSAKDDLATLGLAGLPAALRRRHGSPGTGGNGDAERYLSRVFHGTATPAELVAALTAVQAFAADVDAAMKFHAAAPDDAGSSSSARNASDPFGEAFPRSSLLRRYLREASDPATSETCRALLGALDVAAVRGGRATAATALLPDASRFPDVERTRAEAAEAADAMDALLPKLREQLEAGVSSRGGVSSSFARGPPPPQLRYATVAQVEHLIELPDTFPGVPSTWARVSTNKSKKVARYHPPEVLELAAALERARERHAAACEEAWRVFLRRECARSFLELRAAVRAAAGLDALCSFAALARNEGYCRPTFLPDEEDETRVAIAEGRHPILDALGTRRGAFVPNSVDLSDRPGVGPVRSTRVRSDGGERGDEDAPEEEKILKTRKVAAPRALVVTGPNMGGKSCFIRQTALICVMAQCGSFVPARSATLTALDGVYTRMGAADCLATGASTFLEEMSECAAILRRAGRRSLVVLDELGRGTSTHDGVAVAHATLEHLVKREGAPGDEDASSAAGKGRTEGKGLTLFVTHYPQVAREMRAKYPDACRAAFTSYHAVREEDGTETGGGGGGGAAERAPERVEFLYKLTPGVAHRSFGLNVARMAGLPASVLRAAGAKASALERADAAKRARKEASERRRRRGAEEEAGGDDEAFARSLDVVKSATRKALDAVAEAAARFREDPGGGGAMEALEKRRAEIEREAMTTT